MKLRELDAEVARRLGCEPEYRDGWWHCTCGRHRPARRRKEWPSDILEFYSTTISAAFPIADTERFILIPKRDGGWMACKEIAGERVVLGQGRTCSEAICRAFVRLAP